MSVDGWGEFVPVDATPFRIPTDSGHTIVVRPSADAEDVELSSIASPLTVRGAGFRSYQVELDVPLVADQSEGWRSILWEVPAGALNLLIAARVIDDLLPEAAWQLGLYARNIPTATDPWNGSEVEAYVQIFGGLDQLTTGVAGTTVEPSKYSSDWLFSTFPYHRVLPFGGWVVYENLIGGQTPPDMSGTLRLCAFYDLLVPPLR